MKQWKHTKRCIAMLLAVVMTFSLVQNGLVGLVRAVESELPSMSAGEVVANTYKDSLKAWELNILKSGYLTGDTITYKAPAANESGLVTVDTENKTVTVKNYKDANGNVWMPGTTAEILVDGEAVETINLEKGKGTFKYAGNAYDVSVDYTLTTKVDKELQKQLLSAPYWIAKGVNNLDVLNGGAVNSALDTITSNRKLLQQIVDGMAFGNLTVTLDGAPYAENLLNQMDKNGERLDLQVALDGYASASSKVGYLLNNGADIRKLANDLYRNISGLQKQLEDGSFRSYAVQIGGISADAVEKAKNMVDSLAEDLRVIVEDDWAILDHKDIIRTDLTAAEYVLLDTYATAGGEDLASYKNHDALVKSENLKVAKQTVVCNLNRYIVTVQIAANVIDTDTVGSDATTQKKHTSVALTLNSGATGADILAELEKNGAEAKALESWTAFGVNTENYTRTLSVDMDGFVLSEDTTLTITYTPKELTVSGVEGMPENVPYGYQLRLPVHQDSERVWDYTVNGKYEDQGAVIRITDDTTITRVEGAAWEYHKVNEIIAQYTDNTAVKEILANAALKGDTIRLRVPSGKELSLAGDIVTASAYPANQSGLVWIPVSGTLLGGPNDGNIIYFEPVNNKYQATLTASNYERIQVDYQLNLNWDTLGKTQQEALAILNLPYVLTQEAAQQMSAMNQLVDQQGNLNTLGDNMGMISSIVRGDKNLGDAAKAAMDEVYEKCFKSSEKKLYLQIYVAGYATASTEAAKLAYYYENYGDLHEQVETLYKNLEILVNDPAFESVIPDEYKEYTDKINDIVEKFKDILDDMVAPNEALDLNHANLNALLTTVTANIGRLEERTEQLEVPTMSAKPIVAAPDKVIIKVNIYIKGGNGAVLKSDVISLVKSFDNPTGDAFVMTQDVWNELVWKASEKKTELLNSIGINPNFAEALMDKVSELGEFGGFEELKTNKTYTVTYQYKSVDKAPVYDENGNVIGGQMSYDNPKVNLPECEKEGFRYEYALYDDHGELVRKITGKSHTFEVVELVKGYYIGRTVIDEHRQAILDLVDELNQNLWDNGATYTYNGETYQSVVLVPVEKDGQLTLVLRINPNGLKINGGMAMDTVMTFTNTNVYMEANGQVIKGNQMIGLQGLLDALLSSGLGTDSFVGAVNANGTINEIKVEGEFVGKNQDYIENIELFGGKLAELDMKMGLNAEKARDVKVLVTLENFGRDTGSMSNTYSSINSIRSYLDVSLKNGNLHLDVKIPERGYQAAIVALLALSETRLSDLSSVQVENLTQMIYELIVPVIKDETVDSQTLINTLNSMKISTANLDLSFYDELAPALRKILPDDPTDYGETVGDTYKLTLSYDIKNVINKLGLPERVMNIIDGTNLHMTFALQLRNLNKTFTAMVIDPKASGANILRFYSDVESLQNALDNRSYTSLVILLDDIEGDLTINNKGVVLDLNGHTINGSLIANASTTVVNSNMAVDGCVTGHVKGNVKLTTGIYHEDVSKFLPAGYVQEDGKVVNKYFEVKQDANGDYTVLIKIENALEETKVPSLQAMALEAAYTFILNQYQAASWSFGENMDIYALGYDDLAELLDGISTADGNKLLSVIKTDGITNFLNDFLANLTNFGKIAETGILAEYDVTTAPWAFRVEQNENENRLELGIVNGKTTTRHLTIKIDNTEKVKDLLNALDKVADIDISVKLDGIKVDGTVVSGGGSAKIDAVIDMTRNPNYGLVAAIMVANQINDGRRVELIKAIEYSIETGDTMALKNIMDRVTQAELLTALKNTKRDQFQNILNSLNIQNADKVAQLEAVYNDVLFLGGQLLGALKINGSSQTLDAFEKGFSTYKFNAKPNGKTNINVGGITIALNGSAEINVSIKLFKETPVLGGQNFIQNTQFVKNFWFESDENDMNYSLIESCPNGMEVAYFKAMMESALKEVYSEYDRITVAVETTKTLIHTGAEVTIRFEIDGYAPVDMSFTMVVMGDSNGDGLINEDDSVTIKEKFVNGEELTGAYLKAADGNVNQELDCGDCVLIESKYTYKWNEYVDTLAAIN